MRGGPRPVDSVPDRWLSKAALLEYLGISRSTLAARQRAGVYRPHGRDRATGKPMWKQSLIDDEIQSATNDMRIIREMVIPRNEIHHQNLHSHA